MKTSLAMLMCHLESTAERSYWLKNKAENALMMGPVMAEARRGKLTVRNGGKLVPVVLLRTVLLYCSSITSVQKSVGCLTHLNLLLPLCGNRVQ